MEKRKCELCLNKQEEVHLTCLEEFGTLKKLYLCEKCYDRVRKPFIDHFENNKKGEIDAK